MGKVFCEECRDDVDYVVTEERMSYEIKGTEYDFIGKETRCSRCGALVFVPDIVEENNRIFNAAVREKNGIISLEKIREIPRKYDIGKRPLSLLLGWGEVSFSRFYDGDMPTRQYSQILTRIHDDPEYYAAVLEAGKGNLKSLHAYEKSLRAVNALRSLGKAADRKMDMAIRYILARSGDVTPLVLQKALYYIQGFYHAFHDSFLFESDCEAWVHGPVYKNVYMKFKDYHYDPIAVIPELDLTEVSMEEEAVFRSVVDNLCCYSGKVLEYFTHKEEPWIAARNGIPSDVNSENIISKESIGDYFDALRAEYDMEEPADISRYASEMFREYAT